MIGGEFVHHADLVHLDARLGIVRSVVHAPGVLHRRPRQMDVIGWQRVRELVERGQAAVHLLHLRDHREHLVLGRLDEVLQGRELRLVARFLGEPREDLLVPRVRRLVLSARGSNHVLDERVAQLEGLRAQARFGKGRVDVQQHEELVVLRSRLDAARSVLKLADLADVLVQLRLGLDELEICA